MLAASALHAAKSVCKNATAQIGFEFSDTKFWSGADLNGMPSTPNGQPKLGQFPYKNDAVGGIDKSEFLIPLDKLALAPTCQPLTLKAVAQAGVKKKVNATRFQEEGAYGKGSLLSQRGGWATWFGIKVTCASDGRAVLAALEDAGEIPKLDRSDSIAGPDVDNDGIRDDVQAWIVKKYPAGQLRNAVLQRARGFQRILTTDVSNMTAVLMADNLDSRALNCLSRVARSDGSEHPSLISRVLRNITVNTKARILAEMKFDKAMNGQVISLPGGNTCE